MNKSDLVDAVAKTVGPNVASKSSVEKVLDAMTSTVVEQLAAGNEVKLHGIGKLKVAQRKGRTGRNPRTNEAIEIAPKKKVTLSVAKELDDAVNA